MQQGTWAGELQPPQAQTHVQYMDIQHYSQDPSYPVAAVPQQQQCFDAGSGFQAGQSPQVPQLHGFAGAFQQSTIPGMTVPPTPQTSGSMFMNTNIQSLPGSMPMGDVVNQPNLHPVHLDHQSSMVYPLEQTYHQNGWQDPHPHQRRRRIQPQQQRKQQKNQQRPQQHQQPRQKPKQKKKQAGDEGQKYNPRMRKGPPYGKEATTHILCTPRPYRQPQGTAAGEHTVAWMLFKNTPSRSPCALLIEKALPKIYEVGDRPLVGWKVHGRNSTYLKAGMVHQNPLICFIDNGCLLQQYREHTLGPSLQLR